MNKTLQWDPVEPQPDSAAIVVMHMYYASHKAQKTYRKRVTWCDSIPQVAFVEYLGEQPKQHGSHG